MRVSIVIACLLTCVTGALWCVSNASVDADASLFAVTPMESSVVCVLENGVTGPAAAQEPAQHSFAVTNTTPRELQIRWVSPSCGCFSVECDHQAIRAGDAVSIPPRGVKTIRVSTDQPTMPSSRAVAFNLEASSNGFAVGTSCQSSRMTCTTRSFSGLECHPTLLGVSVGSSGVTDRQSKLELLVTSIAPFSETPQIEAEVVDSSLALSDFRWKAAMNPEPPVSGIYRKRFHIEFGLASRHSTVRNSGEEVESLLKPGFVRIRVLTAGRPPGAPSQSVQIPLSIIDKSRYQVPRTIAMGKVCVGETIRRSVFCKSHDSSKVEISSVAIAGGGVSLRGYELLPVAGGAIVRLETQADTPGHHQAILTLSPAPSTGLFPSTIICDVSVSPVDFPKGTNP